MQFLKMGDDVRISPWAVIARPEAVSLGNHVAIDEFSTIRTSAIISDYVHISPHCSIVGGVQSKLIMMPLSGLAAGCRIICGSDDYLGEGLTNPNVPEKYRKITWSTVVIERMALLGTNVVVLPGLTLAEGCVVGANSLVTESTKPWTLYYGTPAKPIKIRRKDIMLQYAKELGL